MSFLLFSTTERSNVNSIDGEKKTCFALNAIIEICISSIECRILYWKWFYANLRWFYQWVLPKAIKARRDKEDVISSSQIFDTKTFASKKTKKKIRMKVLIVFSLVIVAALAAPQGDVQITKSEFDNIGIDSYNFAWVELMVELIVSEINTRKLWLF